ncbi:MULTISPECIES: baseplate J/gp47 family protein [Clostridium]|uniref:Baseplate J/gp47 family protein n=1 Tax=Clostridium frigoriphilum TaxID=443253 RepID=A0ABU7UU45_9CLOT|nr:baseplate J/gp47 family protein [Clostridium sp. DSM 17811]MBU3098752.1 baseplate J/gp47 family protein [Clostridium sp. DSM 17811]
MNDTSKVIQARLLSNIDDTYDKTEGSFVYDVEKPLSIELETAYADQNSILDLGFADTSTGIYLNKIVGAYGITRKLATYSGNPVTVVGAVGTVINIGDKVASDTVNFTFIESKTIGATGIANVNVKCEMVGTVGNVAIGAIKYFPVTLAGLISVTNTEALTSGYEEETDEQLRERYWEKVRSPSTSGNSAQYKLWAMSVVGVGDAKVTPLWNGNGTVKVAIIDSNKREADTELITLVSKYIEDVRPIGATITVLSGIEKDINISVKLSIDTNKYTIETVTMAIKDSLTQYFKNIAFLTTYVSYAKIGNLLFNVNGVLDYNNLLINNGVINVEIADEEIAVLGVLTNG